MTPQRGPLTATLDQVVCGSAQDTSTFLGRAASAVSRGSLNALWLGPASWWRPQKADNMEQHGEMQFRRSDQCVRQVVSKVQRRAVGKRTRGLLFCGCFCAVSADCFPGT